MILYKKRKAFSMFVAIVVIVIMSTVAMLITSMTGKLVKETTAQYQREQAVLLAHSYTEFAIMSVTANNRAVNCLRTINGTWNGYSARIQIAYIGDTATIGTCATTRKLSEAVITPSTPLTIIVDAYIDYDDLDKAAGAPKMVYHRRTVQKI